MTALYLQMNLGRVNTLIILTLAAHESDIAPHLFRFFISSSMVSQLLFVYSYVPYMFYAIINESIF